MTYRLWIDDCGLKGFCLNSFRSESAIPNPKSTITPPPFSPGPRTRTVPPGTRTGPLAGTPPGSWAEPEAPSNPFPPPPRRRGRRGPKRREPLCGGDAAQFQRPVPLEHKDGARVGSAGDDGGDLTPTASEPGFEPLDIHGPVPHGVRGQAEQNLAVHLGETSQLPASEEVIGVVDGAVVGSGAAP